MLWAALAQAGFEVRVSEGLTQERNVRVPGHTVEELVRVLPPGTEPWTISVVVPEAWIAADLPEYGPAEQLDPAQLAAIVAGLREAGLPTARSGPEQIAQLAAIVQNGSFENERPSAMGPTLLPPWALLAAPQSSLETAPGATGIFLSELVSQLEAQSLETAPGAAASLQLVAQDSAELQESAETAPRAAVVSLEQPPQHSPETAPGAAVSCLLLLQPTRAVARARVAMVKRLFIE